MRFSWGTQTRTLTTLVFLNRDIVKPSSKYLFMLTAESLGLRRFFLQWAMLM